MRETTVDRVLLVVELIPVGRVASYGDIGRLAGVGPRAVGWVLRHYGNEVPWWRVTTASGESPVIDQARPHWEHEGIVVRPDGRGCRLASYRADPHQLAADLSEADQAG
ncbi:MAG: MGMT family protein [Propioniciclava sp.]